MRAITSVLPSILLCAALGCGEESPPLPTRAECEALRAHVVELQLERASRYSTTGGGAAQPSDRLADHRQNLIDSLGDAYVDRCVGERSPESMRCALAANSPSDVDACIANR